MASSVTITATTGPGETVTALVISNVADVNFDLARHELDVVDVNGIIKEFDLGAVGTVTFSISGHNYTITIS